MGFFSSIAKTLFGSKQESKQSKRESNQSPDSPPKDSEFPYTQGDAAKGNPWKHPKILPNFPGGIADVLSN